MVGLPLVHRDIEKMRLKCKDEELCFKILEVFPFTSETKRMGIIVQNERTGEITFYSKGADTVTCDYSKCATTRNTRYIVTRESSLHATTHNMRHFVELSRVTNCRPTI